MANRAQRRKAARKTAPGRRSHTSAVLPTTGTGANPVSSGTEDGVSGSTRPSEFDAYLESLWLNLEEQLPLARLSAITLIRELLEDAELTVWADSVEHPTGASLSDFGSILGVGRQAVWNRRDRALKRLDSMPASARPRARRV